LIIKIIHIIYILKTRWNYTMEKV